MRVRISPLGDCVMRGADSDHLARKCQLDEEIKCPPAVIVCEVLCVAGYCDEWTRNLSRFKRRIGTRLTLRNLLICEHMQR